MAIQEAMGEEFEITNLDQVQKAYDLMDERVANICWKAATFARGNVFKRMKTSVLFGLRLNATLDKLPHPRLFSEPCAASCGVGMTSVKKRCERERRLKCGIVTYLVTLEC